MKLLTEYLDRAVSLERLAANEQDSKFKARLLDQAAAYRKLAAKRAKEYSRKFKLRHLEAGLSGCCPYLPLMSWFVVSSVLIWETE